MSSVLKCPLSVFVYLRISALSQSLVLDICLPVECNVLGTCLSSKCSFLDTSRISPVLDMGTCQPLDTRTLETYLVYLDTCL